MKGPFPPRTKKPPPAPKVKILCSFGGTFLRCQPNGKLRYIGGETRIISVDRFGINLSKLVSRVSELICPPTRLLSFSLKCRLPGEKEETVPLLVPISTDEDVHRMMADYDRLAVQGKPSRLRVFLVLRNDGSSSSGENSTNQEKAAHSSISPTTDVVGSGVQITTTHHHVPAGIRYSGDSYDANVLRQNKMGMGGCSNLAKSGVNGSTNMGMGGLVYYAAVYNQPVGALNFPSEVYNHCLFPTSTSVEGKDRENISPLNNNPPNSRTAKARSAPMSFSNQTNRRVTRVPPLKFFGKNDTLPCNPLPRIKNFRVVESDIGYHWCGHSSLGHRSGLHNLEVRRDSGMRIKMCLGKSYPELRPRSNISKFGQARFTHGNLGRPSDGGNSRGISRNRILEPSYGRSPALKCHCNWVNCSHSSSPHDAGKNPIPHFGSITIEDPLLNPNLANNMVQCQPSCNNDPFSIPLQYSVIYDASTQCKTSSEANSRKLNIKQCSMQSMSTSNVGPVFSNSDSSSGISRKYVESISREPAYGSALPQLNSATQSDNVSLFADICSSRSFLDVLMHLSLSSSAEARLSAPCSTLDGSDVLEADMGTRGDTHAFTRNEVGLPSNHSVHIEDDNHSSRTLTENLAKKTDDNYSNGTSDISLEDAIDLQSKGKDSNPSIMEQQSLGTLDDLTHCDRHQDNMVSSSNTKEEANIKESTMFCSKVVGEASRKLSSVYSQLASEELQTINSSDLEEIRELGSGTYGTVFHGKWKGSDVAIKRLKPSCLAGGDSGEDRLVSDFWKEAQLLSQLHHPNVVAFYGVVTEMENLATVTEYMVNGSLKQVLRRKDRTIDRRKRVIIAMDAAFGMEYLHEKNIVHFDLKSHNFLVNMRDPHRPVCKIGDLGLSKVKQRTLVSGGVRGTIPWMAPELLTSENSMVTEKVDVYSFGIVMWELVTGEEPYDNMRTEEIIAGIIKGNMRPEIPCWCDPTWRLLIERCWSSDPCSRPAFSEIAKELRTVAASMNVK